MAESMYCGIGKIPKGKIRGTPEHCIQANQIRYYGIEAIDPDLLNSAKGKTSNLIEEQIKLKKIEEQAKALINEVKKIKLILNSDNASTTQIKNAKKKMDSLLEKRDILVKKLKAQKKIVESIEAEEERRKKKSTRSKSSKSSKTSRSKTKRNMI